MKNKTYIKYFIIFSIILISLLPVYNFYQYAKNYDYKKSFNIDNIEKYINYSIYKLFNRSMVQEKVITGKEDFLFLGNSYDKVLHKTNGVYRPTKSETDVWTNKLKDLQKWYEDRGIKFVIVIAPNKHSIYKEKLPNFLKYDGKTITDDIVEQANMKNINILDLRKKLIESKQQELDILYWKTDTHWNEKGASIAFDTIINKINNIYQLNLQKPKYNLNPSTRGGGDLANFLKINNILDKDYEKNYSYSFEKNYDICKGNVNKENQALEDCIKIDNPVIEYNEYIINNHSENNLKLLFLVDSFAGAPAKIYNATFSKIYKFHWSHINGQKLVTFVEKNKPDIVIYQIVERNLYNQSIVVPMPKIFEASIDNIKPENRIFDISEDNYFKNNHLEIVAENDNIKLDAVNIDPIIILNQTKTTSKNVILSYVIDSDIDTIFQIFYKKEPSSSYNEIDSYKVNIKKGNNKINLLLPSEYLNNELRLDLVSHIGNYKVQSLKIYDIK
ncbi:alginate O-acetyltransferase AlgX-related protein [Aliarcobacter butzleri]|uniref:alginate O-acetyltransferase AlgX-related protein n=1 Tax=Aliarcobacter butzleri TaxID=28197 RepID=UPI001260536C|nr:hypothetical protein [Aliarcobacter butzleri]